MTIVKRLMLMIAVSLCLMLVIGGIGVWTQRQAQQRFDYLARGAFPSIQALSAANDAMERLRLVAYRHILFVDPATKAKIETNSAADDAKLKGILEDYARTHAADDTERQMVSKELDDLATSRAARQRFFVLSRDNNVEAARALLTTEMAKASNALLDDLTKHISYEYALAESSIQTSQDTFARSRAELIALIALAFLLTVVLAAHLQRVVQSGLSGIRTTLENVSQSLDLTRQAPTARMDEIGHTAAAFNKLLKRIAEVIHAVRQSSESVSVAARQIASGNSDLSVRTEEQATSLEQTAASMMELTETVKHNADNARQANALATNATAMADTGNDAVQAMVETIGNISQSSSKISDITGLIEGIAFQTNILALNAAVEAARAGEQGRGFAVVASEVRSLAQRSAAAAKEIKELIGSSVALIEDGSKQAIDAGVNMGQVKLAIKQVADIVGEIAAASEEQSRGIEQVNQAVNQMDEVTQQNAALVEQAAAAAQSLEEQAVKLKEAVFVFNVGSTGLTTQDGARSWAPKVHAAEWAELAQSR
jgi:methyl-accepting chemotaxis protein